MGYASEPHEAVNYVDAHDNETLFDLNMWKLPAHTSMADRVPPETETAARSGVATNMKAVTCDRAVGQLPVPLTRVKDVPLKEHHVEVLAL